MAAFNGGYTYWLLCGARKRNDEALLFHVERKLEMTKTYVRSTF